MHNIPLGNFSISLAVKDIEASITFYKKLGFEVRFGVPEQGWAILQNADASIGLFQGMFDRNILTFNPGWNRDGENLPQFVDVREIQRHLLEAGLELVKTADPDGVGPDSLTLVDPDGNPILIDQHR